MRRRQRGVRTSVLAVMLMLGAGGAAIGASPTPAMAVPAQLEKGIQYGVAGGRPLLLDAELPAADGEDRPGIILVHGGGWRRGDRSDMRDASGRFADMGWVAFSIDYRLDEPSGFPAEVEDVEKAVAWVHGNAGEFGVDPDRLAIVGSSVGGNLAALAASRPEGTADVGSLVRAVVSFSGPMDLPSLVLDAPPGADEPEIVVDYLGCEPSECPVTYRAASPVSHVDPGDPPMLLVASEEDRVPPAQAQAMMDRLESLRNGSALLVVPGNKHGRGLIDPSWAEMVTFLSGQLDVQTTAGAGAATADGTPSGEEQADETGDRTGPAGGSEGEADGPDGPSAASSSLASPPEEAMPTKATSSEAEPSDKGWLPLGALVVAALGAILAIARRQRPSRRVATVTSRSGGPPG